MCSISIIKSLVCVFEIAVLCYSTSCPFGDHGYISISPTAALLTCTFFGVYLRHALMLYTNLLTSFNKHLIVVTNFDYRCIQTGIYRRWHYAIWSCWHLLTCVSCFVPLCKPIKWNWQKLKQHLVVSSAQIATKTYTSAFNMCQYMPQHPAALQVSAALYSPHQTNTTAHINDCACSIYRIMCLLRTDRWRKYTDIEGLWDLLDTHNSE